MAEAQQPIRLTIELDRVPDALEGRLLAEGGEPRTFAGWLELVAGIDALRLALEQPAGNPDPAPSGDGEGPGAGSPSPGD